MRVPGWLSVVGLILSRLFKELDRHRAEVQRVEQEDEANAIKADPHRAHTKRFGPSAGRVSIHPPSDTD